MVDRAADNRGGKGRVDTVEEKIGTVSEKLNNEVRPQSVFVCAIRPVV